VQGGHRSYIDRGDDEPMTAQPDDEFSEGAPLVIPNGEIVYSEGWQ
jgi:hypothetical protein